MQLKVDAYMTMKDLNLSMITQLSPDAKQFKLVLRRCFLVLIDNKKREIIVSNMTDQGKLLYEAFKNCLIKRVLDGL